MSYKKNHKIVSHSSYPIANKVINNNQKSDLHIPISDAKVISKNRKFNKSIPSAIPEKISTSNLQKKLIPSANIQSTSNSTPLAEKIINNKETNKQRNKQRNNIINKQNISLELPMKPKIIDKATEKLKFKMYKEGLLLYRFNLIIDILNSMDKIIKNIQSKIKKNYKKNINIYRDINKSNKSIHSGNINLKLFSNLLGFLKNNYSSIQKFDSSKLEINSENKKKELDTLIKNLMIYFKETPIEITKDDKIIINYFLQNLINHLYFLFNIDLSLGNNKDFNLTQFYNITIHSSMNSYPKLNTSTSKTNNKTSNKNIIKFKLFRNGLLLYRLNIIQNIIKSITKIIIKIQQDLRTQYKTNLNAFKLKNNNFYHVSYFSNLLGIFKDHFDKISNINPKIINLSNKNKENELNNLIKIMLNYFRETPKEITQKNKIKIEFILQNLINQLYFLFNIDLKNENVNKQPFNIENFYNIILETKKA